MLDLDFDQEQELLRQTVRDVLGRYCPLDVVRQLEDDPVGYPSPLWEQLGELDLIGLLLPEEYGGSGMSLIEGVALYEELGRALAPTPHFASAVMSGGVLAAAGSEAQKDRWLRPVAAGEAILTPAWLEPENGFSPLGVQTKAVEEGAGFRLNGVKRHVAIRLRSRPFGRPGARRLSALGDRPVPRRPRGARRQPAPAALHCVGHAVRGDSERRRGGNGGPHRAGRSWVGDLAERARAGPRPSGGAGRRGARYALEITTQYAKDRQQFDKPLGAFQALAHYLADAVTSLDGAEQLVHEAAWAGANGRPLTSLAPMAKLFACATFRDITAMAQQIFGGIGFTLDFDIQLYFRRAKQQQLMWANDRALEDAVAAALLD